MQTPNKMAMSMFFPIRQYMDCSQKYEPLLVTDYITAPSVPKWEPNFGNYPHTRHFGYKANEAGLVEVQFL